MDAHYLQTHVPLFRGLDALQLLRIANEASLERVSRGGVYYRGLIPPRPAVYLLSGLVGVRSASAAGRHFGPQLFRSGEWLLLNYTLTQDAEPWMLEIYRDATLIHLPYTGLLGLAQINTQFSVNLLQALAEESCALYNAEMQMLQENVEARCLRLLRYLSNEVFHAPRFKLPFTQTQLADLLHTSREVVSRALTTLKKRGEVEMEGREILLSPDERVGTICGKM